MSLFRSSKSIRTVALGALLSLSAACSSDAKNDNKQAFPSIAEPAHAVEKTQLAPIDVIPDEPARVVPTPAAPIAEVRPEPVTYSEMMREGRALMSAGDFVSASDMFARAAAKNEGSALARVNLARALVASGNTESARLAIDRALELDPGSSLAWNTMGRVELAEGDKEAAITSFTRATEEDDDNSYAWNNLGFTLLSLNRHEEAASALENATSGAKPTSYMWNNLGMAYEHLDMIVESRAAYRQGAEAGSKKAEENLSRLEGVTSLKKTEPVEETDFVEPGEEGGVEIEKLEEPEPDEGIEPALSLVEPGLVGC